MKIVENLGIHSGVFTPLIQRLLQSDASLEAFHNGVLNPTNAKELAKKRTVSFSEKQRKVLVDAVKNQYKHITTIDAVAENIKALAKPNALTLTTGHQLNIFTGPLFFWYKILDAINIVEQLQKADATHHYVPVFWMASEDHDLEEINHFFLGEQKVHWNASALGAVGRMPTENFQEVYDKLKPIWGGTPAGNALLALFASCYVEEQNLANATRKLVDQLFGKYGLVIIDGDSPELKSLFAPVIKKELTEKTTFTTVSNANKALSKKIEKYTPQVNPREINLFYLLDNKRVRLMKSEDGFATADGKQRWKASEILDEVDKHPERFSPNALMRPLYQECILPNIAYVGGGGELAYWLQLKSTFEAFGVSYPLLQLRSAVLLMREKQLKKCTKLALPLQDLLLPKASFINKRVRQISDVDIDFSSQREVLEAQFNFLRELAQQTDKSFLGAVDAQEKKQLKGLNTLEKRLLKAQRIKLQDEIIRITDIQNELFPNGKLQERTAHFSEFLDAQGLSSFTKRLKDILSKCSTGLNIVQH
ncbi:MAG: bacillithiol biosynthesis cysteine-adding enzyme BshC [Flavobacteriaceae bacterium]